MSEKLIRTPGSVFVSIESPHAKTTAAARSQPDAWAKVAKAIGSELPATVIETEPVESQPEPKPIPPRKPAKDNPADTRVKRAVDFWNKRDRERKLYEKAHDVESKRERALARLAELESAKAKPEPQDIGKRMRDLIADVDARLTAAALSSQEVS